MASPIDGSGNDPGHVAYAAFVADIDELKDNDELGPDVAPVYTTDVQLESTMEHLRPAEFQYAKEGADAIMKVPASHRAWATDRARDANSLITSLASLPGLRVMAPSYFIGKVSAGAAYVASRPFVDAQQASRLSEAVGAGVTSISNATRDAQATARAMAAAEFEKVFRQATDEGLSREEAGRIATKASRAVYNSEVIFRGVSTGFTANEVGELRIRMRAKFDALPKADRAMFASAVETLLSDESKGLGRVHAYPLSVTDAKLRYEVRLLFEEITKMKASAAKAA